jgi:DNA-binding response OmpR family regulator
MDFARQSVACGGRVAELSTHESGVLRQLAARPGELVPRRALLDAVWGGDSAVTARVVDFHITNLRRKIEGITGEPEPRRILTVHGSGYKLVP